MPTCETADAACRRDRASEALRQEPGQCRRHCLRAIGQRRQEEGCAHSRAAPRGSGGATDDAASPKSDDDEPPPEDGGGKSGKGGKARLTRVK